MNEIALTKAQRELLERIKKMGGKLQLLQVTASSGSRLVNLLLARELVEIVDHPTVVERSAGKPVAALALTQEGLDALG